MRINNLYDVHDYNMLERISIYLDLSLSHILIIFVFIHLKNYQYRLKNTRVLS